MTEIQKHLEKLRKFRIRYVQAICFTAALVWANNLNAAFGIPGHAS